MVWEYVPGLPSCALAAKNVVVPWVEATLSSLEVVGVKDWTVGAGVGGGGLGGLGGGGLGGLGGGGLGGLVGGGLQARGEGRLSHCHKRVRC